MRKLLTTYLKSISDQTSQGDSREESYYDSLKTLFSDFPLEKGRKTHVTVLPRGTEAGNPDFRIWDGDHFIVGYIEAKLPGTNLDQVETSEQLQRYLSTFPNLILTDFYEFRLYRDGKEICRSQIGSSFVSQKLKTTPPLTNADQFQHLADLFFSFKLPVRYTAESLAIDLAKRTRFLRDQVIREELQQEEKQKGELYGFYQAFQKYLLPNLSSDDFADLYAQTITYSLFAARTRVDGEFYRRIALDYIPQTTGILRDVFQYLSIGKMSLEMEVTVDDIAAVLNAADINSILGQYYKDGKGEDPIIHFYETFLNQYDPQTRERRGVYYTPEPVVKYIVRSVHEVLKRDFNLADGLADESVTLLDPAAGTLTFPAEAIKLAVSEYVDKYGEGGKEGFIRNHILRDFYAFELMMAPYAIGHMKIGYLLDSLGYKLRDDDAFKLYLTNTLEMEEIAQSELPGVASLSEESRLAGKVKREPILVIMGNPPYSGHSATSNEWTNILLRTDLDGAQSYYTVDGMPLGERNPKWLQDDYVKFLRFAQWKIQKAGKGIVAMITNHAWLENPTFRGMRQSILDSFDNVWVFDLHGNSLKKEKSPDGSKDENVFDIRAGVAITILVKNPSKKVQTIENANLFGSRERKYSELSESSVISTGYQKVTPQSRFYFLVPRNIVGLEHYQTCPSIPDIFNSNVSGIVTARDSFVIDSNLNKLKRRIDQFRDLNLPDELIIETYNLQNTQEWDIHSARLKLSEAENIEGNYRQILFRPFDTRYIYYSPDVVDRGREKIMRHMLNGENLALITARSNGSNVMDHFLITDKMSEAKTGERTKQSALFPLYLFVLPDEKGSIEFPEEIRKTNINSKIFNLVQSVLGKNIKPETLLFYIYAILYSPFYRETYAEFLKSDYPRIPFTSDPELFMQLANLGERLANLHLLKSDELNQPLVKYQGNGGNQIIEKPVYNPEEKRLYINKNYYFENLEPEVWTYQIGGYQVMDKYLKDRKGQTLEDPRHLIRVATALAKTIEIQEEIDAIYGSVEDNLISF